MNQISCFIQNRFKLYFALIFVFYLCQSVFGQGLIRGKVLDATTNQAIIFASVYINGTTIGCNTNQNGEFELKKFVQLPCELIVSHVGYNIQSLKISKIDEDIAVRLKEREIQIKEIEVGGENQRQKNYEYFKNIFLGADVWGTNAIIKTDSNLIFEHFFETRKRFNNYGNADTTLQNFKWSADKSYYTFMDKSGFIVKSNGPIDIDLPLLGYKLRLDLVHFIEQEFRLTSAREFKYLGYYYYEPIVIENKRKMKKIESNRKLIYYNSMMHFLRSVASNTLNENGYKMFELQTDSLGNKLFRDFTIDPYIVRFKDDYYGIVGLENKRFVIMYYPDISYMTKGVDYVRFNSLNKSGVYFTSDTCVFRKNGTVPGNNIVFTGVIGSKKIGAMLPEDYEP